MGRKRIPIRLGGILLGECKDHPRLSGPQSRKLTKKCCDRSIREGRKEKATSTKRKKEGKSRKTPGEDRRLAKKTFRKTKPCLRNSQGRVGAEGRRVKCVAKIGSMKKKEEKKKEVSMMGESRRRKNPRYHYHERESQWGRGKRPSRQSWTRRDEKGSGAGKNGETWCLTRVTHASKRLFFFREGTGRT